MNSRFLSPLSLTLAVLALCAGGCATRVAAPVSERAPAIGGPAAAPSAPRPGHYVVQQGDTLHRIAQQHGVTFRELAEWNKLDDPNRLEVGRELRVIPPDGVQVRPIAPAAPVEVAPIAQPAPAGASAAVKSGPLGGVKPYSDEAWAAAQAAAGVAAPAAPKPADAPPPVSDATKVVDGVTWSWPSAGKVIGRYAESSARKGLHIGGSVGDPVVAAAEGKVVYAGTGLRGYGKLVIIKHDSSYLSAYAHNDQLMVKEGDSVSKGQQIATLGSSDSDRPKLHFEIRRQGKPVDPAQYLPSR